MAKAPIKKPGKELVKWDEEFAGLAKESTKGMDLPTAKFISIKGGRFKFNGADVGTELTAVITGWTHENQYYDGPYDPEVAQTPACYAFGQDQDTMEPHEKAPEKQNDSCEGCPMNEWGSAGGRSNGKACKNVLRLALIADSDLEDLDNAELVYLKVPVMSVKNFLVYSKKKLADTLKRPHWSVVTKMELVPDDKSQFRLTFDLEEKVEDSELFAPLKELWQKSMEGIDFPYPAPQEREVRKPAGRGKPAPKAKAAPAKFARR